MRYILLLVAVAIVYIVLARSGSIAPASKAVTESMEAANPQASPVAGTTAVATPHTNALKAPLDRTHAVLEQVRTQKAGEQF